MALSRFFLGSCFLAWRFIVAALLAALLCDCSSVEPWERGKLAKQQMSPNPHPLQTKLRTHVQNSREAASGEDVAAGGGCGCY
jgi:hypothetical protein